MLHGNSVGYNKYIIQSAFNETPIIRNGVNLNLSINKKQKQLHTQQSLNI